MQLIVQHGRSLRSVRFKISHISHLKIRWVIDAVRSFHSQNVAVSCCDRVSFHSISGLAWIYLSKPLASDSRQLFFGYMYYVITNAGLRPVFVRRIDTCFSEKQTKLIHLRVLLQRCLEYEYRSKKFIDNHWHADELRGASNSPAHFNEDCRIAVKTALEFIELFTSMTLKRGELDSKIWSE